MKVNIYIHCFTSLTSVISNYLLQVQECTLIVVSVFFFYGYFINGTQRIWTALKTAVIWSSDSQRNLIIYQLSFFFFLNFPLFFCFFIFWSCFSYSSNLFIYLFLIFIFINVRARHCINKLSGGTDLPLLNCHSSSEVSRAEDLPDFAIKQSSKHFLLWINCSVNMEGFTLPEIVSSFPFEFLYLILYG